ncbi:MAG: AAA family ATPase [Pseudomonadota bacterium]
MEDFAPAGGSTEGTMQIRLLGELRVARAGQALALPASKRSRALLAYLVATGSAQSRQCLCDLLWDGPGDPRAELRWSLSKLRPVVDEANLHRIVADRERVAFVAHGAAVDVIALRALLADGVQAAGTAALEQAAALMAGDFLDGLELPACYRFHQWCMAEREWYAALKLKILAALLGRLDNQPERALAYARALVVADPLSELGHAALVRLLLAAGRLHDAETHCRYAENMLQRELGLAPGPELQKAARQIRAELHQRAEYSRQARHAATTTIAAATASAPAEEQAALAAAITVVNNADQADDVQQARVPLVGRAAECRLVADAVTALASPAIAGAAPAGLLLFSGEAGIGKTRMLKALSLHAGQSACRVLYARCFEAEMMRPYGIWIDALRPLAVESGIDAGSKTGKGAEAIPTALQDSLPQSLWRDLAPLLPIADSAAGADYSQGDRGRLFAASAALLKHLAAGQPLVLILDDLQWLDEGSCALLHYLVRSAEAGTRLLLAGAARQGEIDDNPWAKSLLQSLAREHRLHNYQLAPLGPGEVAALLALLAPAAPEPVQPAQASAASAPDVDQVHRLSGGNPLFVLALARAEAYGAGADASTSGQAGEDFSWQALTADQVQRLDEGSRELVCWAAAMGREFRPETLGSAMGIAENEIVQRLDRLERRGLLKPGGEGHYDFAHDLIREAVYRSLSPPRRRAIHRQIARVLVTAAAGNAGLHGELVHHASQAGDTALAVHACIATAEHCLRVFANTEARAAAARGLAMLAGLAAGVEKVNAHIELLSLCIIANAGAGARYWPSQIEELRVAVDAAEALGEHAAAARGLHMLSWMLIHANDPEHTRIATLRAERISRTADAASRCQQLANSGRCLLEVETDVPQARALIHAAAEQADTLNMRLIELDWGRALIARWDGDLDAAYEALHTAVELARTREDRWREFECLVWLATIQLERGCLEAVAALCREVNAVADRMGDVKVPVSDALQALAQLMQSPPGNTALANASLQASLEQLRALDDKAHLAYVQNQAAALALGQGRLSEAQAAAGEALAAAQAVGRTTEIAVARALLAGIAACRPEGKVKVEAEAEAETAASLSGLQERPAAPSPPASVSARARGFMDRWQALQAGLPPIPLAKARNRKIPTAVPTKAG